MKSLVLGLVAGGVVLASTDVVRAHHSFTAAYDSTQRVEKEGVVREFIWRNPHSFVRIEVTNEAGVAETWSLEWGSTSQLQAAKYPVTRTTLRAGDRVIVAGEPGRNPAARRIRIFRLERPVDGWLWEGVVD